jgi:hypothetical protein
MRVRDLIYIGLFGALWGALEMTLGSFLHTLLPPGAAPLAGPIMAALGILIALIGRHFVPQRGGLMAIGTVAALLKLLSLGQVRWGPFLGILIEVGLAELILLSTRRPRRFPFILAGALAVASTLGQAFLFAAIFLGQQLTVTWSKIVQQGRTLLGEQLPLAWMIVLLLSLIYLILGGLAGELAWEVGRAASQRLAHRQEETR